MLHIFLKKKSDLPLKKRKNFFPLIYLMKKKNCLLCSYVIPDISAYLHDNGTFGLLGLRLRVTIPSHYLNHDFFIHSIFNKVGTNSSMRQKYSIVY